MYHWQLSENDDAGSTYVYHDVDQTKLEIDCLEYSSYHHMRRLSIAPAL